MTDTAHARQPNLPTGFDFTDPDIYAHRLPVEEFAEMRRVAPIWWNEQPADVGRDLLSARDVEVGDDHRRTLRRECPCVGLTDALRRPRDDDDLALESAHVSPLFVVVSRLGAGAPHTSTTDDGG